MILLATIFHQVAQRVLHIEFDYIQQFEHFRMGISIETCLTEYKCFLIDH